MAKVNKEIDKEAMYKKLMPSSSKIKEQQTPIQEDIPIDEDIEIILPKKPTRRPIAVIERSVQLKEQKQIEIVNVMEHIITEKLDAAMTKFNCCRCDKCQKDIAALALNKLKPKYVVADPETIVQITQRQATTDATTALVQAILTVKSHPRH